MRDFLIFNRSTTRINMNSHTATSFRSGTRTPVSVIVPVKNEAENLERCLPALAWADEIFVVDSQSTDHTADVAARFGAPGRFSSTSMAPTPRRKTGRSRTCRFATNGS